MTTARLAIGVLALAGLGSCQAPLRSAHAFGGGYYAAPAPWHGPQRYGIPSGPQCRSRSGMRMPGVCGTPPPADLPLPPPGGAWPAASWPSVGFLPPEAPEPPPALEYAPVGPPPAPPPIGWVYGPYTACADPPRCSTGMVSVAADGLNVRAAPGGPPVMALTNGTPLIPLGRDGSWLLVAAACELTPTFAWSWTAGVPLNRCWVP